MLNFSRYWTIFKLFSFYFQLDYFLRQLFKLPDYRLLVWEKFNSNVAAKGESL